ncbi:hypothetical protein SSP531S_17060 [Streptomyces spongiicola]|uniref:Uncharacterized protein n=1 Tax=Streptomyces spongiicola TaxID=1690221 RepID=A0A388SWN9_9ACTN|nr:hypothetical protein [Streptomyces spongiicola]GBQ00292.1 hypothetical protein SSP531S_17060 [Streptomyces spongiicola]
MIRGRGQQRPPAADATADAGPAGPGRGAPRPRARRAAAALAAAVALAAAAGCGIRTTAVPVDAGPAPSRVPCTLAGKETTAPAPQQMPVRVYLVCASALKAVERTVTVSEGRTGDRVRTAGILLGELLEQPSATEREAGFASLVRGALTVSAPRDGDPAGTLRLSRRPEDLAAAALAQVVCTLAESPAAAESGTVVLAGPGDDAPRGYRCTDSVRQRPDTALPTTALPAPAPAS